MSFKRNDKGAIVWLSSHKLCGFFIQNVSLHTKYTFFHTQCQLFHTKYKQNVSLFIQNISFFIKNVSFHTEYKKLNHEVLPVLSVCNPTCSSKMSSIASPELSCSRRWWINYLVHRKWKPDFKLHLEIEVLRSRSQSQIHWIYIKCIESINVNALNI